MTQIYATYDGNACVNAEFSVGLGITPGSGTISIGNTAVSLPKKGTLVFTGPGGSSTWGNVYCVNPRIEEDSLGGKKLVATIYDKRWAWKFGYLVGKWNTPKADGTTNQNKTLAELFAYCLDALGETSYSIYDMPSPAVYPEVNWEYENPANAMQELCDRYGLVIGLQSGASGTIDIRAYNSAQTIPSTNLQNEVEGTSNDILPTKAILIGNRAIMQDTFENLVPVGEDTDGSIKNIDDLSYAPSGAGEGGEAYDYELWGKELLACFSNISNQRTRELAEKCVFKWYAIDWTKDDWDPDEILPLINIISDTVTIEGVEQHEKPYILGQTTYWDGTTFKNIAKAKMSEGYAIDKKLGIVKFSKQQVRTKDDVNGAVAEGFKPAVLDLVAAFERKQGDEWDFVYGWVDITGGTEKYAVHKENSLTGYWKWNGVDAWTWTNQSSCATYLTAALTKLANYYQSTSPDVVKYSGIADYGTAGNRRQVTFKADALTGCSTEVQREMARPRPHIDDYAEGLNKRKIKLDLFPESAQQKIGLKTKVERGTEGAKPYAEGENTDSEPISYFGKTSKAIVRGNNDIAEDIPPRSFVSLSDYNKDTQDFTLSKPTSDGSRLAIAQEAIPTGTKGIVHTDGVHVVEADNNDYPTPVAGDIITGKPGEFKAIKDNAGQYVVIKVEEVDSVNHLYVKRVGGGGGGKQLAKIVATLNRGDSTADPPVEPINYYQIELLGALATPEYDSDIAYTVGFVVLDDGIYYTCIRPTEAGQPQQGPGNATYWEASEEGLYAWVHGIPRFENLLHYAPWFEVGHVVEVYLRETLDLNYEPTGTYVWYIMETVFKVEYVTPTTGERYYSNFWDDGRLKSVFC